MFRWCIVGVVSTEELEEKIGNDEEFVLVDVLSEEHFNDGHIPGAANIPLDEIGSTALQELDKDDEIIVYCKSKDCQASPKAAKKLEKLGFDKVYDYEVGLKGWRESGNEVKS